jgi:hypothetical protein
LTRSRELRRVEAAVQHKDRAELQWAERYCKARVDVTGKRVRDALQSL